MESVSNAAAVEAIASIAQQASDRARTVIDGPDGRQWLVLPDGHGGLRTVELENQGREPTLGSVIRENVTVVSRQSFVDYVTFYRTPFTRLFASLGDASRQRGARVLALIDFHASDAPGRCAHRVVYDLRDSEEWTRWSTISGKLQPQQEFVRFLEENAADIEAPQAADILEIARDFSATRKVNFSQTLRTQTGDVSFEYTADVEAKTKAGHVEIPNMFRLRIPIFYGEPSVEVLAYLRYNIDDGKLKLGIELHRPVFIRQSVIEVIGQEIRDALSLPLHFGNPASV